MGGCPTHLVPNSWGPDPRLGGGRALPFCARGRAARPIGERLGTGTSAALIRVIEPAGGVTETDCEPKSAKRRGLDAFIARQLVGLRGAARCERPARVALSRQRCRVWCCSRGSGDRIRRGGLGVCLCVVF